jgi:ectoine hydroxylase-related dioxygenase (phytanoyl-CoA dioxygenase family)
MSLSVGEHAEKIRLEGYTTLEGVIEPALIAELTATIDRLMVDLDIPYGGNSFLGRQTRRIFNLLSRDPLFAAVPLHPEVLPLAEAVLDQGLLLSSLTAVEMNAGQAGQPFHADTGSIPLRRPHQPIECIAIWTLTDFTAENGGTRLVPRSHQFDRIPTKGEQPEGVVQTELPAGSVLVYDGALWHGGGENQTDARRMGIVCNYCAGWLRQEENQLLALPASYVASLPPRLQAMVGYSTYRGLMGHVDQVDPGTWLDAEKETDMVWKRMR